MYFCGVKLPNFQTNMKRLSAILFVLTMFVISLSAQNAVNKYAYNGKFKNTKITVSIWFEENADGIISGEIVYTSSKHKTPMRILGSTTVGDGVKSFNFTEFQKDGLKSGLIQIKRKLSSGAIEGTWNNYDDPDKPVSYDIVLTPVSFPNGKGGTLAYSSAPAGKYSYHYKHFWKGELGGSVEINNLKGDTKRMSISIYKYDPNIAEYEEKLLFEKGVFHGSIESCDITYDVYVFPDFVRVIYTSGEDKECYDFGAFTTLEGFYLKMK